MTADTSDKREHLAESDDAAMWMVPTLGGLELLKAKYGRLIFAPHAHEEYFIAVTETGKADLRYRGDRHPIGPGDVVVLNPEEVHGGGPLEAHVWGYRSMYPPAWLMSDVAKQLGHDAAIWFGADVVRDPTSAMRLRDAHVAVENNEPLLLQQSMLLRALIGLAAFHAGLGKPRVGPRHPATSLVREYLDAHASESVSLQELADLANLSPYYLCTVFRQEIGVPPHGYQIQIRIRRVRELLVEGATPAEAAVATGFFDQAHLNRHFKRIVGVTPGGYCAAARSMSVANE
jgi:AraC-like DNA-binding protein